MSLSPNERAALRVVDELTPEALSDLTAALRMMEQRCPAQEKRAAWLRFFQNAGYPSPLWRSAEMMRLYIG